MTQVPATPILLRLYERMALLRRFELLAQELNRAGAWPGFVHLYVGEEAVAAAVCDHLRQSDWISSTHRGHGHAVAKGVPPEKVLAEIYGKATGASGGRGGSMHIMAPEQGLIGTNGIVGGGVPLAVGAGLSARSRGTDGVGVAFFGDGASSHGAVLESLNFAGAQKLPVVFVCENNLFATATPIRVATANPELVQRAAAFGIAGVAVDGNDVLAMWEAARAAVERARAGGGPTLIEAKTYRWCGHHEGDPVTGTYRTEAEVNAWKERCPLARHRRLLVEELRLATHADLDALNAAAAATVAAARRFAESSPYPDPATLYAHVRAAPLVVPPAPACPTRTQGWLEAVRDGVGEEMRRNPAIIYLGEGIGERGGCFAHSKGLWQEFGGKRVIDTGICELAFTGAAIGASATGCRAVADLMFADFLFEAGSQIIHQAAKLRYLSEGRLGAPVVIRAPMGMVKCAGAHHSGAYYPCFGHIPGLMVAVPSNPADAKGLMKTALRSGDPVLFLEHKGMFSSKGEVPTEETLIPFGVAAVVRLGTDVTIATCGMMVRVSLEAADLLQEQGISAEVIDLRTISPLDAATVAESVRRTGRLLVVDEAWARYGLGGELAAAMNEMVFDYLDAPIGRLHTPEVPFPFSPTLDAVVGITAAKVVAAATAVIAGRTLVVSPGAPGASLAEQATKPATVASTGGPAAPPTPTVKPAKKAAKSTPVQVPLAEGEAAILLPNMDLTIEEATVVAWLKRIGDLVALGEPVAEVETDKASVQIESTAAGRLVRILVEPGSTVPLGTTLGIVTTRIP